MERFIESMRLNAWKTAGARYNASRRLEKREKFATFSLAMLSTLSIAISIFPKIYTTIPGTPLDNYLSATSIGLGVALLTISLLESAAAHGRRAEALHKNAEELTAYQLKLAQVSSQIKYNIVPSDAAVTLLRVEYENIKNGCSYNHSPLDYKLFLAQQRLAEEFRNEKGEPPIKFLETAILKARWHLAVIWYFLIVWIAVAVALLFAVFI